MIKNIEFLGHATFKISGSRIIYTDPYNINTNETAAIILISHSHYDHCSIDDIKKVSGDNTTIVSSKDCTDKLKELAGNTIGLEPGEEVDVNGVKIKAIPAYNITKKFHPKSNKWNGYIFNMNGVTYYHSGDTDKIPEMKSIDTDVAFLPVGGKFTMDYKEAIEAVLLINPKIAIPMHYGSIIGSIKDAELFVKSIGEKGKLIYKK